VSSLWQQQIIWVCSYQHWDCCCITIGWILYSIGIWRKCHSRAEWILSFKFVISGDSAVVIDKLFQIIQVKEELFTRYMTNDKRVWWESKRQCICKPMVEVFSMAPLLRPVDAEQDENIQLDLSGNIWTVVLLRYYDETMFHPVD